MCKIVHCKKEKYDVYIGRPSKWGNPFSIGKDGSRTDVIEKFRKYFQAKLRNGEIRRSDLEELKDKTLGCWCAPQPCHGDVLKRIVEITFSDIRIPVGKPECLS